MMHVDLDKGSYTILGLVLVLSVSIAFSYSVPIGADIHFHLEIARVWAGGENGMFSDVALRVNKMPYPPLLHLLLVPGIWMGCEYAWARLLQALMLPLAMASILYTVEGLGDNPSVAGLLLLGSGAYYDRLLQAIPQSLDMILYPLAVLSLSKKNYWRFSLFSILLIYNHGIVSMAILGGSFLILLLEKRYHFLTLVTLVCLPIIIPSSFYFFQGLGRMVGPVNAQERAFWAYPIFYTLRYLGTPLFGVMLMIALNGFDWKQHRVELLNMVSTLVMVPFWPERALSYLAPNLALIASRNLSQNMVLLLSPIIGIYHLQPWLLLFSGGFHVKG